MTFKKYIELPRLPLDGRIDLTYRCDNNCRHCWLWLPPDAPEGRDELTFEEIRNIVDQARAMGCQAWSISGGEPMLRPDFIEIFDYLTHKSVHYSLNTNGTLITPKIAHLLKRKGTKMVALYGATAKVHDHITRIPGSFKAAMRGIAYLKEAGAPFTVQIIPMRANYHQYKEMLALARNLSKSYRVGSSWLFLSACRSDARNCEIAEQRLDPADVIALDEPNPVMDLLDKYTNNGDAQDSPQCDTIEKDDRLFASCIEARRDFHVDPYGQMSFCSFIKEPSLRYNLREGTFRQAWEEFIPSLSDIVRGGQEYMENCGSCNLRKDCKWCGVYAYLEHGRFSAKVEYLCRVAEKARRYKEDWNLEHIRFYQIAGVTIQVTSELPITDNTFARELKVFEVDNPGVDKISIHLVPSVPDLSELRLGREIYRRPPWMIFRQRDSWAYLRLSPEYDNSKLYNLAIFNDDHSRGTIFNSYYSREANNLRSLTTFTTDQILLTRVLANHQACYLHAAGIILNSHGLLFVGHSDAGKSTMMKMLKREGEILCDDRIIVRRWPEGFRIHGTWSHGELPDISSADAPLKAIMFLEQANTNELIPITDKKERLSKVLSHVVKSLETPDWWEKILSLAGIIAREIPAYRLRFDKSGRIIGVLKQLYND